jgi:DNA-binding NtrC family response regulator
MNQEFSYDIPKGEAVTPALNSPGVAANTLQALKLLAGSILSQVSSLERNQTRIEGDRFDLVKEVERFETHIIRCALVRAGGRQRQAALLLNIKPTTLHYKMKRYGLSQEPSDR